MVYNLETIGLTCKLLSAFDLHYTNAQDPGNTRLMRKYRQALEISFDNFPP